MNEAASMSEAGDDSAPTGGQTLGGVTAGAMLREAREKRGLHIAALAASIKVTPRKLEALEADRYAELPDMTFTRALAQTVCRVLKVDPEPVLAKLPAAGDLPRLAKVGGGINTTFREAPGSQDPGEYTFYRRPVFWATLIVLLGAIALALIPERWVPWHGAADLPSLTVPAAAVEALSAAAPAAGPPESAAPAAEAAGSAPVTAVMPAAAASASGSSIETVHSAPPPALASGGETGMTTGVLAVRTSAESWVEVQDGRGQTLLSRTIQPGETVGLDGPFPFRLTIGNAAATQLTFRGEAVDLSSSTRDNVARLQLPKR
jgi:cytoskeleton protein RodZ